MFNSHSKVVGTLLYYRSLAICQNALNIFLTCSNPFFAIRIVFSNKPKLFIKIVDYVGF
jgi:hypothetical protein